MAMSWIDEVMKRGRLTVFAGPGFSGGPWITALEDAIRTFNELMAAKSFYLDLVLSTEAPTDTGGANVHVEAAADQAVFSFGGKAYSKAFDGNGLHGLTRTVSIDGRIEKAYVFAPKTPRVEKKPKAREVGGEVRRFLLVHEFIHAAGLSNDEHTLSDVFCYPAELHEGSTAAGDRLHPWGSPQLNMPPYLLTDKTLHALQSVWPYCYR